MIHGHAHHGGREGKTVGGVPVYNVALHFGSFKPSNHRRRIDCSRYKSRYTRAACRKQPRSSNLSQLCHGNLTLRREGEKVIGVSAANAGIEEDSESIGESKAFRTSTFTTIG